MTSVVLLPHNAAFNWAGGGNPTAQLVNVNDEVSVPIPRIRARSIGGVYAAILMQPQDEIEVSAGNLAGASLAGLGAMKLVADDDAPVTYLAFIQFARHLRADGKVRFRCVARTTSNPSANPVRIRVFI